MLYVERQRKWIKEVGLEIGDKVLIVGKSVNGSGAWDGDDWVEQMDETVGLTGVVVLQDEPHGRYTEEWGIRVETEKGRWNYPFFVLVKV